MRAGAGRARAQAVVAVNGERLPMVRAGELEVQTAEQRWLFEGLWGRSAIGLIGGAPKSCKSWLGLDMAVSVASGTPALGHFPAAVRGPALVYLAEDALPQIRERIESLCRHRSLSITALELFVITVPSLRIDRELDQVRLAATIDELRPRLLLLDPLVRLHALDENSAAEISGLLGYIRGLQRRFDLAVVLVHHASKRHRAQPGQSLRGSSDLHAIGDSNAYLARKDQHIVLTLEHRAARAPEPLLLELTDDDEATTHLRVCDARPPNGAAERSLEDEITRLLGDGRPLPRTEIRSRLRVNNQRLGDELSRLERLGRLRRTARGWILVENDAFAW